MTKDDEAAAGTPKTVAGTSNSVAGPSSAFVKSEPSESRAVEMPLENSATVEIPCKLCDKKFETQCDSDQHFQLYHMIVRVNVKRLTSDEISRKSETFRGSRSESMDK